VLSEATSGPDFARECQTWNSSVPDCGEPQKRGEVIAQQILVLLVLVPREHGDALDELRPRLLPAPGRNAARMPSGIRIIVSGRSARCGSM
jgi:hypothetical protein